MPGLLTTAEIAERWGCTQQWVQSLIKRGKLKAELMGTVYVVRERDVEAYEPQPPGRPGQNGAHRSATAKRSQKKRRRKGRTKS